MASYRNNCFVDETILLDGSDFQACSFQGCKLVYGGGALPNISDCSFEECSWQFDTAAGRTVTFIRNIAEAMGSDGRVLVENLFGRPTVVSSPPG